MLLDRVGLITAAPHTLQLVADRLDRTAERCGPAIATYSNPAKTLASELADSLPLIWSEGAAAGPAGRRFAATLAELAGRPALAADLPEALPAHGVLLSGGFAAAPTPTTSSATEWKNRRPFAHASSCCATGPQAD